MRVYSTLAFVAAANLCFAQDTIPNPSFESWTNHGGYETPDGWFSTNDVIGFAVVTVSKSTDAVHGTYSARLNNGIVGIGTVAPGVVTTGEVELDAQFNPTFKGGVPYSKRPDEFLGQYKFVPGPNDTGFISVTLTVYDNTAQMSLPVGTGGMEITDTTSWTSFMIPITYFDPRDPDTLLIVIGSSRVGPNGPASTVLYVDSLAFPPDSVPPPPGGLQVPSGANGVAVFPNPARDMLTIEFTRIHFGEIWIYDVTGALLEMKPMAEGRTNLDVSSYANGLYLYSIGSSDGRKMATGKFAVNR